MRDSFQRNIEYVRISITDLCNLRCRYCMPEAGVKKLRHGDVLTYEEILRVVRALAQLGIRKVRLTGGEPLLRPGIVDFVRRIKGVQGIEHVAMTTNGVLLSSMAEQLKEAGLDSVNVSVDTLREDAFVFLTRRALLPSVQEGLEALFSAGFADVKLNCVPIAGVNEEDIVYLAGLARQYDVKVRFIELMPIGCAFEAGLHGIPMDEVRKRLSEEYGTLLPVERNSSLQGPAEYACISGFRGQVGFIDAMGHKFCHTCNRVRLTAEGFLKLCLYSGTGLDVRVLLRSGAEDGDLAKALARAIRRKPEAHSFLEESGGDVRDARYMYQVGG